MIKESELTVEYKDISLTVVIETEVDGLGGYTPYILDIKDEVGNSLYDRHVICALPDNYRELSMEDLADLPKSKEIIEWFRTFEGELALHKAIEEYHNGADADNYFYQD